jgi:glutaminase
LASSEQGLFPVAAVLRFTDNTEFRLFNENVTLEPEERHSFRPIPAGPSRRTNLVNMRVGGTTSLVPGVSAEENWRFILNGLSRFAGHPLEMDSELDASEQATNCSNELQQRGHHQPAQCPSAALERSRHGHRPLHPPVRPAASGDWLHQIGLPGKSGVSGGMITVAPANGPLATWSPPLAKADAAL